MERFISIGGLIALLALAWLLSESRRKVDWRLVVIGLALQFGLALIFLRTSFRDWFFEVAQRGFGVITDASNEGARFVFGALIEPFTVRPEALENAKDPLFVNAALAFSVLPTIIVISAIAGILYHLRVIQAMVRIMAWLMQRTLRTSGAETFGAALQIFTGIESMPALKGYLRSMTRSELFTVMMAFMASVATNVLLIYAQFDAEPGHLMAASVMSAPAAILFAKILVPEREQPQTLGRGRIAVPIETHNVIDAAARGASEGLMLALNVGALLIAFVSIVYLINWGFDAVFSRSFTELMGYAFRPFAFLMGVPREDVGAVGNLLGTKTILNEFIAYSDMKELIDQGTLSPRSVTIATYALCGFANPGSLGILLAGLSGLVPERRGDLASLGLKSLIGGTFATFSTACIVGVLSS